MCSHKIPVNASIQNPLYACAGDEATDCTAVWSIHLHASLVTWWNISRLDINSHLVPGRVFPA